MLSFSAEFPVDTNCTTEKFISAVKAWVLDSPHTVFNAEDLVGLTGDVDFSISKFNYSIKVIFARDDIGSFTAFRHKLFDNGIEWNIEVVFSYTATGAWIGVRTSREADVLSENLPPGKKPVIVRTLLEQLGGGFDGSLRVSARPHFLAGSEIQIPAKFITGSSDHHLPVVYISCGFDGAYGVDPNSVASDLAGMAHVVVEPDRPFSYRLQIEVNSGNAYGGAIGIYWPDASGSRSLFKLNEYRDRSILKRDIISTVRFALMNRRPITKCTWAFVEELFSRKIYEKLRNSGSENVNEYISAFDQEIKSKDDRISAADQEIERLKAEIKKYERQSLMDAGITLKIVSEQEFDEGEFVEIIVEILTDARRNLLEDGRRYHIVNAVIESQIYERKLQQKRDFLKDLFKGYRTMDSRIRSELQSMGFSISDDGKHYKAVYKNDPRYTFSIAKTSSDHRSGLNLVSDIAKKIF